MKSMWEKREQSSSSSVISFLFGLTAVTRQLNAPCLLNWQHVPPALSSINHDGKTDIHTLHHFNIDVNQIQLDCDGFKCILNMFTLAQACLVKGSSMSPFYHPWMVCFMVSHMSVTGPAAEPELPEAVPSRSAHQAAEAGLHHPHPAVDLRSVLQGAHTHYHRLTDKPRVQYTSIHRHTG